MIPMKFFVSPPEPETLKHGSAALYEPGPSRIRSPMANRSSPMTSFQCLCFCAETAISELPSLLPVKGQDKQAEHYPIVRKPRKIVLRNILKECLDYNQGGEKSGYKSDEKKRDIRD